MQIRKSHFLKFVQPYGNRDDIHQSSQRQEHEPPNCKQLYMNYMHYACILCTLPVSAR